MFLPTYAAVVLLAPLYVRVRHMMRIRWFVDGVTAAATGAIAGSVFVLGQRALPDVASIAIAVVTLVLLLTRRPVPEPLLIIAAGLAGLVLHGA
jgi:chromate transporter